MNTSQTIVQSISVSLEEFLRQNPLPLQTFYSHQRVFLSCTTIPSASRARYRIYQACNNHYTQTSQPRGLLTSIHKSPAAPKIYPAPLRGNGTSACLCLENSPKASNNYTIYWCLLLMYGKVSVSLLRSVCLYLSINLSIYR